MFFELRQYVVRPGKQAEWVKCMEEEIIPFQVKMGMVTSELRGRGGPERVRVESAVSRTRESANASTMRSTRVTTGRTRSAPRSAD